MSSSNHRQGCLFLVLAALALVLAACRPSLVLEPAHTPQVIRASITPSLNPLRPLFKRCIAESPQAGLVVTESIVPSLEQADLALGWGANSLPGEFAAVLGEERLAFIVHPQNSLDQISLADLIAIYQGTRSDWPSGGPAGEIQPWAYPGGEDIQQIFAAAVGVPLPGNASAIAPDPAAMVEAVAASHQAIGFLPGRWLDERVKEVQIEGIGEDQLRQPILALSESEPEGLAKSWLLCLQENLAENSWK